MQLPGGRRWVSRVYCVLKPSGDQQGKRLGPPDLSSCRIAWEAHILNFITLTLYLYFIYWLYLLTLFISHFVHWSHDRHTFSKVLSVVTHLLVTLYIITQQALILKSASIVFVCSPVSLCRTVSFSLFVWHCHVFVYDFMQYCWLSVCLLLR